VGNFTNEVENIHFLPKKIGNHVPVCREAESQKEVICEILFNVILTKTDDSFPLNCSVTPRPIRPNTISLV